MTMRLIICVAALALTACGPTTTQTPTEPAIEAAAPATPSGPPVEAPMLEGDHPEAWVTETVFLSNSANGAKVYSVAGGDPAINGLYTYIAGYDTEEPGGGWRVFQIGDFNTWRVLEDRGTEVVLEVTRSTIADNGDIQTAGERYIVSVPDADDTSITITPAS
jgi:hypothetical protein